MNFERNLAHSPNPEEETPKRRKEDQREAVPSTEEQYQLPMPIIHEQGLENYIMEHKEVAFEGSKEILLEVIQVVKEDPNAIKLIEETLEKIFRYVEMIYRMEIAIPFLQLRSQSPEEYKEKMEAHDVRRKRAHDALISTLISCTRYLNQHYAGQVPETGIYKGDPISLIQQDRLAIAEWAIELESEILQERVR